MSRTADFLQVGYFLPGDGWKGNAKIHRAKNNLKTDWIMVQKNPPKIIKEDNNDQSFQNFDGDVPLDITFYQKVLITTGEDYTQTQGFDITTNANIPVSIAIIVFGGYS
jgi:hypothetical protein